MALLTSLNQRLLSRRTLLSSGAAAGLSAVLLPLVSEAADVIGATIGEIRPFKAEIPEAALTDLRRRLAETRWPDGETVTDRSQVLSPTG